MSETNRALLERANAAIVAGDHETFLACCTDDVVWTFVGDRTLRGKAAVRDYLRETYREPPTFGVDEWIESADHVTAIGEIALRDADGRVTRYDYCDVWRVRDGRLASLKAFVIAKA